MISPLRFVLNGVPHMSVKVSFFANNPRKYTLRIPIITTIGETSMSKEDRIMLFKELFERMTWAVLCECMFVICSSEMQYDDVVKYIDVNASRYYHDMTVVNIEGKLGAFLKLVLCEYVVSDVAEIILLIYVECCNL
jgi:hypothetical protein